MKMKYKVVSSTKQEFLNIELDLVISDDEIGTEVNVLGGKFKITQNGKTLGLKSTEGEGLSVWVMTLLQLEQPKEEPLWSKPLRAEDIRVNQEIDIFLETKEIVLYNTDRLSTENGITYKELFRFLEKEWFKINMLVPEMLPADYVEDLKLLNLRRGWKIRKESIHLLKNGSFTRWENRSSFRGDEEYCPASL